MLGLSFVAVPAVVGHAATQEASGLQDVLVRAAAYVGDYERKFSAVVSEEDYTQQVQGVLSAGAQLWNAPTHRVTRSDVLLISLGHNQWLGFRDVFEVDGRPIRDHVQRLQHLILDTPGQLISRASQISAESARFNLGSVERTVNVPTLALQFLAADNQPRSTFRFRKDERVEGVTARVLQFTERASPTIIRGANGDNRFATGRFWLDPATGRVLQTELRIDSGTLQVRITVNYQPNAKVGMWVPATMNERYDLGGRSEIDTCKAVYSNVRKFTVNVGAIKRPAAPRPGPVPGRGSR